MARPVPPVQKDTAQEIARGSLDGPFGAYVWRDVLGPRQAACQLMTVVGVLALRTVVAMAEREHDGLSEVVFEEHRERVGVVESSSAASRKDERGGGPGQDSESSRHASRLVRVGVSSGTLAQLMPLFHWRQNPSQYMGRPGFIARAIKAERRWGAPANEFAVRFYEWFFVLAGPAAIAFGLYALSRGWWGSGLILVVFGAVTTFLGYVRLWRWVERRRRDERQAS